MPAKQTTEQKLASMRLEPTVGYVAAVPDSIPLSKSSMVVGSDPRPGSKVDVLIALSSVGYTHMQVTVSGSSVEVMDMARAPRCLAPLLRRQRRPPPPRARAQRAAPSWRARG